MVQTWVAGGTSSRKSMTAKAKGPERDDEVTRGRILTAAFAAFTTRGYAETTTLEIAKRARVSKRELYTLVGNKREMLVACIEKRAHRLETPSSRIPVSLDQATLARALEELGARLLREVSAPAVLAVFRLAIAEAKRAPEVARALNEVGREASRAAAQGVLEQGCASGLLEGEPSVVAERFTALLWGELLVSLLLRVAEPPDAKEMNRRARAATSAIMRLHAVRQEAAGAIPSREDR
jgi:AcrR family transcriptional regulator